MKSFRCLILTMLMAVLIAPAAQAADFYVNNQIGEDFYDGRSPQLSGSGRGPLRTLGRALYLANGGDQIHLAKTEEPYRETVALFGTRHSGSPERPTVIYGNGAVLDGATAIAHNRWEACGFGVYRFVPTEAGPYQQLFLDGKPAARVVADSSKLPKLDEHQWCYHQGAIYFKTQPPKTIRDYNLTYAALTTGITLYFVEHVAIVDLTVQGFRLDGIHAANSARDIYLAGVITRGNGRAGIVVGGASRVEIEASLSGSNGAMQLLTAPWSETFLRRCRLLDDSAPGWVDQGGRVWVDGQKQSGGLKQLAPPDDAAVPTSPQAAPGEPNETT